MNQMSGLFSIFLIFSSILLSLGQDYCRICRDHTMCIYRNPNPACVTRSSGLTSFQRSEIIAAHNGYRQLVARGNERRGNPGPQPPARNMPVMLWDEELARIAQRWANQCKQEHDRCRNVASFQVGQNIGALSSTGTLPGNILTILITLWYDEVALFDSRQVENVRNFNRVGHYTQMLWATSTKIGCGSIRYLLNNRDTILLICNYGPAGNILGGKMYDIRR